MPLWKANRMIYIGIDNGVTGTLTFMDDIGHIILHCKTPVKKELSYTKTKQYINRIDTCSLTQLFKQYGVPDNGSRTKCFLERPMIMPGRFKATISAVRSLEATLIVIEQCKFMSFEYCDSKQWQKTMLPTGLKGPELKTGAMQVAKRLYPNLKIYDADSILIAEWARSHKK